MYELIAIWFFTIALLNLSAILIVKIGRSDLKTTSKNFVLVNYCKPIERPIQRLDRTDNVLLLDDISERDYAACPKCHQFNMSNPDMDVYSDTFKYPIPLVAKHKYRGANINALCQTCVDKLHKDIDNALDGPLDKPATYGGIYHHNGKSENLDQEFEILIDGKSVYTGYDYRMIKQVMGKASKPDKYATSWLSIADIKHVEHSWPQQWLINDNLYQRLDYRSSHTYDGISAADMPKVIAGLKAQGKEYIVNLIQDKPKRYMIAERIPNKELVKLEV
jgi:hypothetical protein